MKTQHRKTTLFIVILVFFFCLAQNTAGQENHENILTPKLPHYELMLDINELNIFTSIVSDALSKYGGNIDFELNAAKNKQETLWTVIFKNPKFFNAFKYWMSEKLLEIIKTINPEKLNSDNKTALKVMKSLADKMEAAKNNPVWDEITISGKIIQENNRFFIKGTGFQSLITGKQTNTIKEMKDKTVILHGFVKQKNQIEASQVLIKKENTLELFVMSQCPFAKKAEESIINFINTLPDDQKPELSIRYIFYFKHNKFTCMHGHKELMENLVQILIRDNFNQYFFPYLLERNQDKETSWQESAAEVGMSDKDIKTIENKIITEQQKLIQTEYDYAVHTYKITDGSPTYVWESEVIPNIREIELFKDLDFSTHKKCLH